MDLLANLYYHHINKQNLNYRGFEQVDTLFKLSNLQQESTFDNLKAKTQLNRNKSIKIGKFNKVTISSQKPITIDNRGNKIGLGGDLNFVALHSLQKTISQPKINQI